MMVVTVEVWPGGRVLERRVIGTMGIANVSQLADVSDYDCYVDGEYVFVEQHKRSDGAWELVRRALEELRVESPHHCTGTTRRGTACRAGPQRGFHTCPNHRDQEGAQ